MEKLSNQDIITSIKSKFNNDLLEAYEEYGMLVIVVPNQVCYDVIEYLKTDSVLNYHFLTDLCAVHYPMNIGAELEMVYHLHNWMENRRIRVKSTIPINNPVIKSLTSLWNTANWQERETFDFYGVIFDGHPDLRRIVNMDEMDYHPQLKQYPLEDATREDKNDAMFGR